jgi:hypothetical protein
MGQTCTVASHRGSRIRRLLATLVHEGWRCSTYFAENKELSVLPISIGKLTRSNWSLEWTSASWPRYAGSVFSAPRGQLAAAPQLER